MLSNFNGDSVTTDFIETSDNENKYLQWFQSLLCVSVPSPQGMRESCLPCLHTRTTFPTAPTSIQVCFPTLNARNKNP